MGIRAGLGNLGAGLKSAWDNTIQGIFAQTQGIFDAAVTKIGSIYTGGFIGINADKWPEIKTAVETLITHASADLDKFNELAKRDDAIKGLAEEALGGYLANAQKLLNAYVQTYKNFIADAETALGAMNEGDRQNAQNINEASQALEREAQSIVDSIKVN